MTDPAVASDRPRWLDYQDIEALRPDPRNAKAHATSDIRDSIRRFAYTDPVAIDERTGLLVSGHGRVAVLREMREAGEGPPEGVVIDDGAWLVPVTRGWSSENDDEAAAWLVAANQLTIAGGWQPAPLAELLQSVALTPPGLVGIGFRQPDLDALLGSLERDRTAEPEPQPRPIRIPENPVTQPGDIWLLGPHRLMCGDCREPADVAVLIEDRAVNLAFTSPPYADRRDYDESSGFRPVKPDEYVEWFAPVAENVARHLAEDGSWFVNIKPPGEGLDTDLYVFDLVTAHVRQWGWHFATEFCWERNGVPKQVRLRFKNQFEPVYQFVRGRWKVRPENVRHWSENAIVPLGKGRGNSNWADHDSDVVSQGGHGDLFEGQRVAYRRTGSREGLRPRTNPDIKGSSSSHQGEPGEALGGGWAYPGNRLPTFTGSHEALGHAAAFPIGLPEWFVKAFTDPEDVVFDPFAGTGSTVLAAHRQDRIGLGLELSPAYVDIAVARFQSHTGIVPVLAQTGEAVDFTAQTVGTEPAGPDEDGSLANNEAPVEESAPAG